MYSLGYASTTVIISVDVAEEEDCKAVRSWSMKELTILGTSAARLAGSMFCTRDMSACRLLLIEAREEAAMAKKRMEDACILMAREACLREMTGER